MKAIENTSLFMTGANGGLGLETAKILAEKGIGHLVMATRTDEKGAVAKQKVQASVKKGKTKIETAGGFDMNLPESIESAVDALPTSPPFDVVFFQVGGVFFSKDYQYVEYAGQRIEKTVFQNVIGSYITLVNLKKRGLIGPRTRVVFAGGEGARGIPGMIEKPVFDSASQFRDYVFGKGELKKYNPMNAIGVSKLSSALLVQKLAEMGGKNEYVWFTPGLTHGTNGLASASPIKRFFMEKVLFGISGLLGFSQSPKKGAEKYVSSLVGGIGKNGDVLGAPEGKVLGPIVNQKPMNTSLTDTALIEEFWSILQSVYPMQLSRAEVA